MYIYVMYICIVLHYVFFLISCHLYSCFQAPRGFCNMRYINIYYYYYYYFHLLQFYLCLFYPWNFFISSTFCILYIWHFNLWSLYPLLDMLDWHFYRWHFQICHFYLGPILRAISTWKCYSFAILRLPKTYLREEKRAVWGNNAMPFKQQRYNVVFQWLPAKLCIVSKPSMKETLNVVTNT